MGHTIYEVIELSLSDLLDRVSSPQTQNGPLRIPDLQRPYVWTPAQVSLLIDSLIRGWPFGTLVLWRMPGGPGTSMPSRPFWTVVDRTDSDDGQSFPESQVGFHALVLDGQQRLQSLALALVGDRSGFKLLDKEWFNALNKTDRPRRPGAHWTRGELHLDLEAYVAEFKEHDRVDAIDYVGRALVWAVMGGHDGESAKRRDNYKRPLPFTSRDLQLEAGGEPPRTLVRLNRLWLIARKDKARRQKDRLEEELRWSAVPEAVIREALDPVAELLEVLGELKETKVSCLQIRPPADGVDLDEYSEAVVNIFTRLNTAGRQLTRQEITFAWIKHDWDKTRTGGRSADQCFEDLRQRLREYGLKVEVDDVVQIVGISWAVLRNQGRILQAPDLLDPAKVRPLATDLMAVWGWLPDCIVRTAELIDELGLVYGRHFESVNAFALLAAWRAAGIEWSLMRKTHVERDGHQYEIDALVRDSAERWLVMSQWAGVWSGGRKALDDRSQQLAEIAHTIRAAADVTAMTKGLRELMQRWLDELRGDAKKFVEGIGVSHRDEVTQYRTPLWIWHRLGDERWVQSRLVSIPNRNKNADLKSPELDVDHLVSFKMWKDLLGPQEDYAALEGRASEGDDDLNAIGNCALLDKQYNISKSKKPLGEFLDEIKKARPTQFEPAAWLRELRVHEAQVDPSANRERLRVASEQRTRLVKDDLLAWIDGGKETCRLHIPKAPDAPAGVNGK